MCFGINVFSSILLCNSMIVLMLKDISESHIILLLNVQISEHINKLGKVPSLVQRTARTNPDNPPLKWRCMVVCI